MGFISQLVTGGGAHPVGIIWFIILVIQLSKMDTIHIEMDDVYK